jgi:hypothetical protein
MNVIDDALSTQTLQKALDAAAEMQACQDALSRGEQNLVSEVLRCQGTFYEMDHYPKGDVYDNLSHSQYYYHAHRSSHDEHGHFHLFQRLPDTEMPADASETESDTHNAAVHLIAVSMNKWGLPTELFTVNRWVTGDNWIPATSVIALLERFSIKHAYPNWAVNRYLTAMLTCYRHQIMSLVRQRDQILNAHMDARSLTLQQALEDRTLEVVTSMTIDLEDWYSQLEAELLRRRSTQ